VHAACCVLRGKANESITTGDNMPDDKLIHVRLNAQDRAVLTFLQSQQGTTKAATVRVALRAAASKLGFKLTENISGEVSH
jgi:hypothetical protein